MTQKTRRKKERIRVRPQIFSYFCSDTRRYIEKIRRKSGPRWDINIHLQTWTAIQMTDRPKRQQQRKTTKMMVSKSTIKTKKTLLAHMTEAANIEVKLKGPVPIGFVVKSLGFYQYRRKFFCLLRVSRIACVCESMIMHMLYVYEK